MCGSLREGRDRALLAGGAAGRRFPSVAETELREWAALGAPKASPAMGANLPRFCGGRESALPCPAQHRALARTLPVPSPDTERHAEGIVHF